MEKQIENEKVTKVSFLDADRNKVNVELEITYRNGYKEFTVSGDYGSGGGQIVDHIKPANDAQKRLVDLWNTYHLNGMSAGTPKQQEVIEKWKAAGNKYDYDKAKQYLQSLNADGTEMSAIKKAHLEENIAAEKLEIKKFKKWIDEFTEAFEKWNNKKTGWFIFDFTRYGFIHDSIKDQCYGKKQNCVYFNSVFETQAFVKRFKRFCEEKGKEFDQRISDLEIQSLYVDRNPETGELFKYGHGWYHKQLPENIEEQIEEIVQDINDAEEERKGEPLDKLSDEQLVKLIEEETDFEGRDAELAAAFVRMFDLTQDDLGDIKIEGNRSTVQGTDYLAGTDEEMDEEWDEDLENYIDECLEIPDNMEKYFDREQWKEDARKDGRGHSLNRYDGGEETAEINSTVYYAYQQ